MSLFINRHILSLTSLDSGLITPMMAVMHHFQEPGGYQGTLLKGEKVVSRFYLMVDTDAPLKSAKINVETCNGLSYIVNPKAYTLFHSPMGAGGYSVRVQKVDGKPTSPAFDNRELEEGDIFAASLFRPGQYTASNQKRAHCRITVARPTQRIIQYNPITHRAVIRHPAGSSSVDCSKDGFKPDKAKVELGQTILFHIKTASSRIKIQLETPEDKGPSTQQRQGEHPPSKKPKNISTTVKSSAQRK